MLKEQMSSLSVHRFVQEARIIEGSRFRKAYQLDFDTIILSFSVRKENLLEGGDTKEGIGSQILDNGKLEKQHQPADVEDGKWTRADMLIKLGGYTFLTGRIGVEMPMEPSQYAMILRKELNNRVIESVEQPSMDRIVILKFSRFPGEEDKKSLVVELFGDGNMILVKGDTILAPYTSRSWSSRIVKRGEPFSQPPSGPDPRTVPLESMVSMMEGSDEDLVHFLIRRMGLPPLHSEEICFRIGTPKTSEVKNLDQSERPRVYQGVQEIMDELSRDHSSYLHMEGGEPRHIEPILLRKFFRIHEKEEIIDRYSRTGTDKDQLELLIYDSISAALEENLFRAKAPLPPSARNRKRAMDRLTFLLKNQETALQDREREAELFNRLADNLYMDYTRIDGLLRNFDPDSYKEDPSGYPDVLAYHPSQGKGRGKIEVSMDTDSGEEKVTLDLDMDINANAEKLYERSKKSRRKLEGIENAMEKTRKRMEKAEKEEESHADRAKQLRQFWFENFRWCFSSKGVLMIGGRDAKSNERLVKKYMRDQDLYAHADIKGAPSVVLRKEDSSEIDENSAREGCHFSVLNSKAWKSGIGSEGGYWVQPNRVSRTPQAGEFLPKGSFMIRGKKNFQDKLPLEGAAGLVYVEGVPKIMFGPEISVKEQCKGTYFRVRPGKTKKSDIAKIISKELGGELDQVISVLPPGNMDITKVKREENG